MRELRLPVANCSSHYLGSSEGCAVQGPDWESGGLSDPDMSGPAGKHANCNTYLYKTINVRQHCDSHSDDNFNNSVFEKMLLI